MIHGKACFSNYHKFIKSIENGTYTPIQIECVLNTIILEFSSTPLHLRKISCSFITFSRISETEHDVSTDC